MGISKSGRIPGDYRIDRCVEDSGFDGLAGPNAQERVCAKFRAFCRERRVKSGAVSWRISVKMAKSKKPTKKPQNPLDRSPEKRSRGRPYKIRALEVSGRAYNYRLIFNQTWDVLGEQLLKAKTEEEALQAFEGTPYKNEFAALASLILEVLRDADFPKRDKESRINFLADSLAARGVVTPRTSRDICAKERARKKSAHRILCHEFYVECSCGYEGPARNNACRKCGAEIDFLAHAVMGRGLF
jgi:hypothetical protein